MSLPVVEVIQQRHTHVSLVGRVRKRIIVCCDGTWEDGTSMENEMMYTNVVRLARAINHEDSRFTPPIPQVVYYQSGIGSEKNFYAEYIEGPVGSSLADKVEEAYAFISQNYHPGDEIFLFGFSRGAYTARMVAMLIGSIGILDRKEMDNFARIFILYQKLGKSDDEEETSKLKAQLAPYNVPDSPGRRRALSDDHTFSVKCIGVFDTVGALGLPDELRIHPKVHTLFGFPDRRLGEHVERAYQALALNEPREDFDCCKFEQTEQGRQKKQILRQCWFSGCHADCGGGYRDHDLADLTLTWMVAHLTDILSVDVKYLASLLRPVAPWGTQVPHTPLTGMYRWARTIQRPLPDTDDDITHETIHPSVLVNEQNFARITEHLAKHPGLVAELLPLEKQIKALWPTYSASHTQEETKEESIGVTVAVTVTKLLNMIVDEI